MYMFAVSMKFTPSSSARLMMAVASAWPTGVPNVMVPRQMGEMEMSVLGTGRSSMFSVACQARGVVLREVLRCSWRGRGEPLVL